jgi:hypothetical protein
MNSKKIMDSQWTFKITTLSLSHKENEKCGFKKYIKICENKILKIQHHQMKN